MMENYERKQEYDNKNVNKRACQRMDSSGKWISVKDRLPESAGWYLVFYNGSEMHVAFFKGKKWPFDNHYHKITHWMPLPEPPKEG